MTGEGGEEYRPGGIWHSWLVCSVPMHMLAKHALWSVYEKAKQFTHLALPYFSWQQWGLSSSTFAVPLASYLFWLDSAPTNSLFERSCRIYFRLSQSICSGINCGARNSSSHLVLSRKTHWNERELVGKYSMLQLHCSHWSGSGSFTITVIHNSPCSESYSSELLLFIAEASCIKACCGGLVVGCTPYDSVRPLKSGYICHAAGF